MSESTYALYHPKLDMFLVHTLNQGHMWGDESTRGDIALKGESWSDDLYVARINLDNTDKLCGYITAILINTPHLKTSIENAIWVKTEYDDDYDLTFDYSDTVGVV